MSHSYYSSCIWSTVRIKPYYFINHESFNEKQCIFHSSHIFCALTMTKKYSGYWWYHIDHYHYTLYNSIPYFFFLHILFLISNTLFLIPNSTLLITQITFQIQNTLFRTKRKRNSWHTSIHALNTSYFNNHSIFFHDLVAY